jgi:hypothetical protein
MRVEESFPEAGIYKIPENKRKSKETFYCFSGRNDIQLTVKGGGEMEEKKFYLPGVEISEALHKWLRDLAEKEKRSMSQQLIWELEQIKKKG